MIVFHSFYVASVVLCTIVSSCSGGMTKFLSPIGSVLNPLHRATRQTSNATVELLIRDGMCSFVEKCWSSCDADVPPLKAGLIGEQGPTGPAGYQGFDGPVGLKGESGEIGIPGKQGPQGPQGQTGEKGAKGQRGEQGELGALAKGERGIQGDEGDSGDEGEQGPQGCKGQKGDKGDIGLKGEKGVKGNVGPLGEKGIVGPKGDLGPVGVPGQDPGPQGPPGQKGMKGDKGIIGSPGGGGEKGKDGFQGRIGSRALMNVSVIPGFKGNKGLKGFKGAPGDCSVINTDSNCQLHGSVGEKGTKGELGPVGPRGMSGPRGDSGDSDTCDGGEDLIFVKGNTGRPGSRAPLRQGSKGNPGPESKCTCNDIQCPAEITYKCEPKNYTVPCEYKRKLARPGPRGPKGEAGDIGPKGDLPGLKGDTGTKGQRGKCELCPEEGEPVTVTTAPSIYVVAGKSECPGDHEILWTGILLTAITSVEVPTNGRSDISMDYGGVGSCLPMDFESVGQLIVSFDNIVGMPRQLHSMWALKDDQHNYHSFWVGRNNATTGCAVCKSSGAIIVVHGTGQCPETNKPHMAYKTMWTGRTVASITSSNLKFGAHLESTSSCVNDISMVKRSHCDNCHDDFNDEQLNTNYLAADSCVVCSLEPVGGISVKFVPDGDVFVQHSQAPSVPGCKAGHTQLYSGYSLLSTGSGHEASASSSCSESFAPLVTGSACAIGKSGQRHCQAQLQNSTWMLSADYVPSTVERVAMASVGATHGRRNQRPYLRLNTDLVRKFNFTDLNRFSKDHISRCSVCLSRAPIYVQHGLDETNMKCKNGFSKLWQGYSFVMASIGGRAPHTVVRDLSSPESCLRAFEPISAIDCPVSMDHSQSILSKMFTNTEPSISNVCRLPFSIERPAYSGEESLNHIVTHWLANQNDQPSFSSDDRFFSSKYAHQIGRCVVCEMALT